jgi:Flp pilus assembly pilin Flp
MKRKVRKEKGQAIVEYIIIVVIVAIAAFVVLGAFSDRLRNLIGGATNVLGGNAEQVDDGQSASDLQSLEGDGSGLDISGG